MAITVRTTFYALKDGVEVNHISGTSIINNIDDALQKVRDFTEKNHPEASDITVMFNEKRTSVGMWIIGAQSNIDPGMHFVLVITRLI